MTKNVTVGKVDGSGPTVYFELVSEAEAFVAELEKTDPEGVHAGNYYIDAPEDDQ